VKKSGRSPTLTNAEEAKLAAFITDCAQIGYPLRKLDVIMWVKKVMDVDGRENPFTANMPGYYQST
jgi:hypothetical protein